MLRCRAVAFGTVPQFAVVVIFGDLWLAMILVGYDMFWRVVLRLLGISSRWRGG